MSFRRGSLVVLVYVAAAVVLTWPLAATLTTRLGAPQGPGDPFLNLWILGWGLKTWTGDPSAILDGRVFNANIFFPAEGTLTYSDHFLLQALALSPIYAISQNAVLCYNLLVLLSVALSGLAMHAFVRAVTGSAPGAFLAGLAWACWPYRTAHLLHIQLQALYFMPLAMLALHRVVARRRWRDALLLGMATALQAIASVYYGVMTMVALAVAGAALAVATGQWRSRRLLSRVLAAAIVSGLLTLPVLIPYMRSQQSEGFGRTLFEAGNHSAALQSYTQVPPSNAVWGRSGLLAPRASRPGDRDRRGVEDQLFPGIVLVSLALVGVIRNRRSDARPMVASGVALVAIGGLLSLGPEGFRTLYAALHDNVFGFQAIRAPARFAVLVMLGLAPLAALGLRAIGEWRQLPGRAGRLPAILVAVAAIEYVNVPLTLAEAPPASTETGRWLSGESTPGPVLYLPLTIDIESTPFMVQSLEHGRAIVNGYSGQRPAFYSTIVNDLSDFPSPTALATIRELEVRFVVSPEPVAGAGNDRSPLVERVRLADGVIYEVRWTPAAIVGLDDAAAPAPPPPGPIPFSAGEVAVYDVHWEGGPVDLPAGTATLSVSGGPETWTLEARAETADWVTPFFRARDRFVTTTDRDLLPVVHERDIREGRREVTRAYLFDRAARHVRIGASREEAARPDAMTLPLGHPDVRDAVAAFYYVRTLPLAPGSVFSIPLNEAGAGMTLQVATGELETIDGRGGPIVAIRIEPRLMRRLERRRPLAMTVWLSRDARRVPLRVLVDAGFGRVNATLREYRKP